MKRIFFQILMLVALNLLAGCGKSEAEINLALYQPASSSVELKSAQAWLSFDGMSGSGWSPGEALPQWIEVDLGAEATVSEVRLLVNQPDRGQSRHVVWIAGEERIFRQLVEFRQETGTGDWLEYRPDQAIEGIRYLKVESLEGDGWVGWLEVEVWGRRPASGALAG